MKRLLVLILALVYMGTTTGATMHMHFCMGQLAGWSLWGKDEGAHCGRCGMEKTKQSDGCCSDEAQWFKIKDDQKAAVVTYDFTPVSHAASILHVLAEHHMFFTERASLHPQSHAPPDLYSIAIYKRHRVFRI